eukprot:TRINITY_DN3439_c0_g1_i1.p1 TRINITY_DN3439_c0_g1~~TRINITY_DN3439_c0_g1_i1.p1  ORF type:complete len:279 (+),score=91.50 TRINITY_DN3439_c0_g1_i1:293-1129(+)
MASQGVHLDEAMGLMMANASLLKEMVIHRSQESRRNWVQELGDVPELIENIEETIEMVKKIIEEEKQSLSLAEEFKKKVERQNLYVKITKDEHPSRFTQNPPKSFSYVSHESKENIPSAANTSFSSDSSIRTSQPSLPQIQSLMEQNTKKVEKAKVATMNHISRDELESVPKYMKGRITMEKVNQAIDDIQSVLSAKYKTLSQPIGKLSGESLAKFKTWRDEETKDTKGVFFVTENDLKHTSVKNDATGKSILAVLRHLNRLRELGGTTKRFGVVTSS